MAEYTKADREQLGEQLAAVCRRCLGSGDISGLTQLSGGASMESWRFCFASRDWVLRRLPGLSANLNVPEGVAMLSLADQALLLQHVYRQGVSVPEVLTILLPEDGVGDGFVMACVA
jgi:aminoglycoside phosphotransferase (APT) family kinase protein